RGRDRQLDLAAEASEPGFQLRLAGHLLLRGDCALPVAGRSRRGQIDVGDVALVEAHEAWTELSCSTGQQYEQPGNEGERRRPAGLVNENDAGGPTRPRRHPRTRATQWRARTRGE